MSTFLFNPTSDDLVGQYAGRTYRITANGGRLKVDDSCGRHLLNYLGDRGLTFLEIDTDVAKVAREAVARSVAFKKRMVMEYNMLQEQRKQVGMAFMSPTPEVRAYAQELQIALSEPYSVREESGMVQALKDQVSTLTALVQNLLQGKDVKVPAKTREILDPSVPGPTTPLDYETIGAETREEIGIDQQGPPEPQDPALILEAPVKIGAPAKMKRRD